MAKLTKDERRKLVLDALTGRANRARLAREAGISRAQLYRYIDDATADAAARLEEARKEHAFRARVITAVRGIDYGGE